MLHVDVLGIESDRRQEQVYLGNGPPNVSKEILQHFQDLCSHFPKYCLGLKAACAYFFRSRENFDNEKAV